MNAAFVKKTLLQVKKFGSKCYCLLLLMSLKIFLLKANKHTSHYWTCVLNAKVHAK